MRRAVSGAAFALAALGGAALLNGVGVHALVAEQGIGA